MIWGKRRFHGGDFAPYHDRLEELMSANAEQHREFMMFMIEQEAGVAEVYVGVPSQAFMLMAFDGFELVPEEAVPTAIDALLVADPDEFRKRFEFKHDKPSR